MLKTVENKEELENLIIKDIDKIVLHVTVKDVKTDEESEMQIDITDCNNSAITIDKWEELNIKKMRNEIKKKISIECLNYNMEFKKDDNKNNFLTYMWKYK